MVIGSTFRSSASRPPSQAFVAEPRVRSLAVLAESAANPQSIRLAEDICRKRYPNDSTALALTRGAVMPSSTALTALAGPSAAWADTMIALAGP